MATSSIFRTPQFETEESARSLVEAIEATMADKVDYRRRISREDIKELRTKEEIRSFFGDMR